MNRVVLLFSVLFFAIYLNSGVDAISCFHYEAGDDEVTRVTNKSFCMADYFEEFRNGTFYGLGTDNGITKHPSTKELENDPFCNKAYDKEIEGGVLLFRYMCYCFQDFCNYPFTYVEFEKRGFNIDPVIPTEEPINWDELH